MDPDESAPTTGSFRAYRLLERLGQAGTLFNCLGGEYAGLALALTTNRFEGGTNAQFRRLMRAHQGMSETHQNASLKDSSTCTASSRPASLIGTL
jgi:hypothetical protein